MKEFSPAAVYAGILPDLIKAGREIGYAIGAHGSFARDLDLIAVPWVEEAGSAEELIMRLLAVCGGRLRDGHSCVGKDDKGENVWERRRGDVATPMPHGRRGWSIHLGDSGLYLDVSVMPRAPRATPPEPA